MRLSFSFIDSQSYVPKPITNSGVLQATSLRLRRIAVSDCDVQYFKRMLGFPGFSQVFEGICREFSVINEMRGFSSLFRAPKKQK
jgi:hypothetical protein